PVAFLHILVQVLNPVLLKERSVIYKADEVYLRGMIRIRMSADRRKALKKRVERFARYTVHIEMLIQRFNNIACDPAGESPAGIDVYGIAERLSRQHGRRQVVKHVSTGFYNVFDLHVILLLKLRYSDIPHIHLFRRL